MTTNYFGVAGAVENSMALYTPPEATIARDRLAAVFDRATSAPDAAGTTVMIIGGGPTGVETAGALAELRNSWVTAGLLRAGQVHVVLVQRDHDLLPANHPRLRRYALDQLIGRGVEVRLTTVVESLSANTAVLSDGTTVPLDCALWTAGVTAAPGVAAWGLPQGRGGRIRVADDLRVIGHSRIFAVGDLSVNERHPLPQLAQQAIQTGRHAGKQVRRLLSGRSTRPFGYHNKGTAATIGRGAAVVELPLGVRITGVPAWIGWLGLHIVMLLGNRNRVATLLNLSWRYLSRPAGAEVVVADPAKEVAA